MVSTWSRHGRVLGAADSNRGACYENATALLGPFRVAHGRDAPVALTAHGISIARSAVSISPISSRRAQHSGANPRTPLGRRQTQGACGTTGTANQYVHRWTALASAASYSSTL